MSRDGVVRVGSEESENLEEEVVDEWLTGPWTGQHQEDHLSKLKLYAQTCKQKLGTHQLLYFQVKSGRVREGGSLSSVIEGQ